MTDPPFGMFTADMVIVFLQNFEIRESQEIHSISFDGLAHLDIIFVELD